MKIKAALFDLDGVLVDTARYHYEAWLVLANQLSIPFTEKENEQLKGISRTESLERLLSFGKMEQKFSEKENQPLLSKKTIYIFKRLQKIG
jgi:bPGM: beta-phosphoglucomutase